MSANGVDDQAVWDEGARIEEMLARETCGTCANVVWCPCCGGGGTCVEALEAVTRDQPCCDWWEEAATC